MIFNSFAGQGSIYCPKCGTENPATNERCLKCGAGISGTAMIEDEEKKEMKYQQDTFQWKWVIVGLLLISLLHFAVIYIASYSSYLVIDINYNPWGYMGLSLIPYFVGGILIGWFSSGKTFLEPVYASILPAIGFPIFTIFTGLIESFIIALSPIIIYIIVALFGSWIGEKFQGSI